MFFAGLAGPGNHWTNSGRISKAGGEPVIIKVWGSNLRLLLLCGQTEKMDLARYWMQLSFMSKTVKL